MSQLTWLHISDAHFGAPDASGEAPMVIDALLDDIARMRDDRGFTPDFLFFTGDIAFGEVRDAPLEQQYLRAQEFLGSMEKRCNVRRENMFLVPGNHDVNRTRVDKGQTNWLDSLLRGGEDPTRQIDELWSNPDQVTCQRYLERLENYAAFIQRVGLKHLLQDRRRLTYTHRRQVGNVDVAITGLNTAWSSCRDSEKGKLWLGQSQIHESIKVAKNADVAIALGHHPPGWFNEYEDPAWYRTVSKFYNFYLHGHEHDDWVSDHTDHVRIAAGALYERRLATATGYNVVRLDFEQAKADVFLRQYDPRGRGWVPSVVFNKTDDSGCWPLKLKPTARRITSSDPTPGSKRTVTLPAPPIPIDVNDHFSVASAIPDEERFVGRRNELRTALQALRAPGAAITIFGMAGLGKSSLALEIARIASGIDRKLCESPALAGVVPMKGFNHRVVYYSCRHDIDLDLEATMRSVLQDRTGDFHLGKVFSDDALRSRGEEDGIVSLLEPFARGQAPASPAALDALRRLGSFVYDHSDKRELVVILDEFNVVGDKRGFATLIKGTPQIKFVLVGTAVDVCLLIQDHASIPRQLAEGQIRLRPMSVDDLINVISNEEARGQNRFSFSAQAKNRIAKSARGVPFFVHFVGRYALDMACRDIAPNAGRVNVELSHVDEALQERLAVLSDLENAYVQAIGGRWERELALKLLSEREEETIALVNLRSTAEKLGIQTLDTPIRSFVKGGVLVQEAHAMYQFQDTRLRVYARLRDPVTDQAKTIWARYQTEPSRPL